MIPNSDITAAIVRLSLASYINLSAMSASDPIEVELAFPYLQSSMGGGAETGFVVLFGCIVWIQGETTSLFAGRGAQK